MSNTKEVLIKEDLIKMLYHRQVEAEEFLDQNPKAGLDELLEKIYPEIHREYNELCERERIFCKAANFDWTDSFQKFLKGLGGKNENHII